MTIVYRVCGKESRISSCYGSIRLVLEVGTEPFTGLELVLDETYCNRRDNRRSGGLFLNNVSDKDAKAILKLARKLGFSKYLPRTLPKLKKDGGITFDADVPFFIVAAVTGFFRLYANHDTFMAVYDLLRSKGLDEVEAFLFCNSILLLQGTNTPVVYLFGEHSIVPWSICNRDSLDKFRTWLERSHSLESMADEYERTKGLSYTSRDVWFGATQSGNSGYTSIKSLIDGSNRGCITVDYIKTFEEYQPSEIDIDSLVAEIKSWRTS